jgi:hypothetical protein
VRRRSGEDAPDSSRSLIGKPQREPRFAPDTSLGQAVGAALAQLIAESHPGQDRKELNMTERTPVAARCKALSNFHYGHRMPGSSRRVLCAGGGIP